MKKKFNNWTDFYRKINFAFNGIIAASLVPFGWLLLEMQSNSKFVSAITDDLLPFIVLAVILLMSILLIWVVKSSNREMINIPNDDGIGRKLGLFYRIFLRQYLIMELIGLNAIVGLFFTRHYLFVCAYLGVLFWFSRIRPTYDFVVRNLLLKDDQIAQLASEENF